MNRRFHYLLTALVLLCGVHRVRAQEIHITAFHSDGLLMWSGAALGTTCQVQQAYSLIGNNWTNIQSVVVTNDSMTTVVPTLSTSSNSVFYRIVGTTGMEASLTADHSVYTNIANHLVICPPCTTNVPPCEVPCRLAGGTNVTATFAFQVTNASSKPQTLTFLTGQRFDLQLIDTNGTVVAAWSDGKAFPQYATTVTYAPGQTQDYSIPMVLEDRAGNSLSGPYTARAFLTNTGPPVGVEATTQIRVVLLLVP